MSRLMLATIISVIYRLAVALLKKMIKYINVSVLSIFQVIVLYPQIYEVDLIKQYT